MKKTYQQPAFIIVELGTNNMMALSMTINNDTDDPVIESPDDILTKENRDVNLWNKEW
ncbi:MAG: hypothetical protein IJ148_02405 [Bacteroidaceae bacterium]|nr:hypothetical protein [Bacteroidaceae bacterium]